MRLLLEPGARVGLEQWEGILLDITGHRKAEKSYNNGTNFGWSAYGAVRN